MTTPIEMAAAGAEATAEIGGMAAEVAAEVVTGMSSTKMIVIGAAVVAAVAAIGYSSYKAYPWIKGKWNARKEAKAVRAANAAAAEVV